MDDSRLGALMDAAIEAKRTADEAAAGRESAYAALREYLFEHGLTDCRNDAGVKANILTRTTSRVDPAILVALGVEAEKVAAATKTSTSDPYVQLYFPKGDGDAALPAYAARPRG